MANSNAKRTTSTARSTTTSKKDGILKPALKFSITSVIIPILVAVVVTQLNSPPSIEVSTAHTFLTGYFNEVTDSAQRISLYQEDLTANFRSYPWVHWTAYSDFWQGEKSVSIISVIPVPGNSSEFAVSATYQPMEGRPPTDGLNFWLVCTGIMGNLQAHIPDSGCPLNDIKIDNKQVVQHSE